MLLMLIKRIVPFALALALGLFIASFFISLTLPKLRFERRYQYRNSCSYERSREREHRFSYRQNNVPLDQDEMDAPVPPPAIQFENYPVQPPAAPTVPHKRR